MGAVADDGGTMILSGNSIRTQGERSIGLFSVTEQVGAQFPANLTATNVTLETLGLNAHGVAAQARNDVPVETATATINTSSITTRGNGAVGLRATLGDYGTRPLTGRGEAAVIANSSTVLTEGIAAHGALSRDNPTSVTMNQTSVLATGSIAHGSVAEAGGRIIGNDFDGDRNGYERISALRDRHAGIRFERHIHQQHLDQRQWTDDRRWRLRRRYPEKFASKRQWRMASGGDGGHVPAIDAKRSLPRYSRS